MALLTPMICEIARGIFDYANPDVTKLLSTPESLPTNAFVFGGRNRTPVSDTKWNVSHLHGLVRLIVLLGKVEAVCREFFKNMLDSLPFSKSVTVVRSVGYTLQQCCATAESSQ